MDRDADYLIAVLQLVNFNDIKSQNSEIKGHNHDFYVIIFDFYDTIISTFYIIMTHEKAYNLYFLFNNYDFKFLLLFKVLLLELPP